MSIPEIFSLPCFSQGGCKRSLTLTLRPKNRSKKFLPKSFTLMCNILELVKQGKIAADIARTLNMSKQDVYYYFTKGKDVGYIKQVSRTTCAILELTQAGKNFLDRTTQSKLYNGMPILRLENIQFKARILKMPTKPFAVDWKKIEMHNWTQYTSKIDSVNVRLNDGAVSTLVLLPSPVEGDEIFQLYTDIVFACVNAILELHNRLGLKVGHLELGSRGEWLVYDPVAKSFCKNTGQITINGVGKVNASPPRHIGEIEFYDPRNLVDYMLMPKRVQNIESMLEKALNLDFNLKSGSDFN
jgi:hypothetical protein